MRLFFTEPKKQGLEVGDFVEIMQRVSGLCSLNAARANGKGLILGRNLDEVASKSADIRIRRRYTWRWGSVIFLERACILICVPMHDPPPS
jgi:hypothetical protein